jgi:hypothetical protein
MLGLASQGNVGTRSKTAAQITRGSNILENPGHAYQWANSHSVPAPEPHHRSLTQILRILFISCTVRDEPKPSPHSHKSLTFIHQP